MIYFDQQPADRQIGKRLKQLTEPWTAQWVYKGQHRLLFAPEDYIYDGASIPRIAWSILGIAPSGPIDAAALAHDVPYRAKGGLKPEGWMGASITDEHENPVIISRREADWVFKTFGIYADIPKRRMVTAHVVVRALGDILGHWGGPPPNNE